MNKILIYSFQFGTMQIILHVFFIIFNQTEKTLSPRIKNKLKQMNLFTFQVEGKYTHRKLFQLN